MLQEFLDAGLLEIGEDDSRFNSLVKASDDLAKSIINEKTLTIPYALVAVDPNVPNDEPTLDNVEDSVKQHWRTLRNLHTSRPLLILRAVLLQAMEQACRDDPTVAAATWLTASSILPLLQATNEQHLVSSIVHAAGNMAEAEAVASWSQLGNKLRRPRFAKTSSVLEAVKPNVATLTKNMHGAVGPQGPDNQPIAGANPQWPNSGQPWALVFAPRAAKAVNATLQSLVSDLDQAITKGLNANTNYVERALKRAVTLGLRTQLLWWKETLYSPSLHKSYRNLPNSAIPLIAAIDLHNQVTRFAPQSVEFLLREVIRETNGEQDLELKKWLENATTFQPLQSLLPTRRDVMAGRIPLVDFLRLVGDGTAKSKELSGRVGVDHSTKIAVGDFAVWIFRDLQAARLVANAD